MIKVENIYTNSIEAAGLVLMRGWSDTIARQLVELSKEAEIRKFTPKDEAVRFTNVDAANKWYNAKKHVVYVLQHKNGEVGGLLWFSYEPREDLHADYTIGIRLYGSLRGKGLSGDFMEACHTDFRVEAYYQGSIWLVTDAVNERARHVYATHAYLECSETDGRVLLVRAV